MKRTNTLYISSKNKFIVYHWKYKMSSYHPNLSKSNNFNSNDTDRMSTTVTLRPAL